MELAVSKWVKSTKNDGKAGKWITKKLLMSDYKYDKYHDMKYVLSLLFVLFLPIIQVPISF